MWALKIRARERWGIYNFLTRKFKVKVFFYSQNYYEKGSKTYYIGSGIVSGKNKERFLSELKKDRRTEYFESNNDFFICTYSEPKNSIRGKYVRVAYNPRLVFLKPVVIDEEGWEEWEIASVFREDLEAFVHVAQKNKVEHKVLYLKKQKITNLMIYSMLPKLSPKQKQALILAIEHGYYGYPRNITLEKLSRMMKISLSTYQFHLAKAEAKIMPFVSRSF